MIHSFDKMRRGVRSGSLLLLTLLLSLQPARAGNESAVAVGTAEKELRNQDNRGGSRRGTVEHIPYVLLRGTARERGEAYGALCGKDVVALLSDVLVPVINAKNQNGWRDLVQTVQVGFRFPPEMQTQMRAFLKGLTENSTSMERRIKPLDRELQIEDLEVLQVFADLASSGKLHFGGCSSFSAWGDLTMNGEVITGRNLDYTTFPGKMPMMIVAQEPSEPGLQKTVEISIAGVFGASTAMNEEGVMVLLHDEPGLQGTLRSGWVPRIAMLRQAIERARKSSAVEDIAQSLRGQPVIMGGNIHVSFPYNPRESTRGPAVLEWDGNAKDNGVTVRGASSDLPAIFCTNHYLERGNNRAYGSSGQRYDILAKGAQQLSENNQQVVPKTAMELMAKASVRGPVSTYISIIGFPRERRFLLAFASQAGASATDSKWVEIEWSDLFDR